MKFDDLETITANSFSNFHAKGLDYICLVRSPLLTLKAYFFEQGGSGDVVVPHDHRYDFRTFVLDGSVENVVYGMGYGHVRHERFQEFDYETPLNGGTGFVWKREVLLHEASRVKYFKGDSHHMRYNERHTIRVKPGTVLLLSQYEDRLPLWASTSAYSKDREPPSMEGLYDKPSPDQIAVRLKHLKELGV